MLPNFLVLFAPKPISIHKVAIKKNATVFQAQTIPEQKMGTRQESAILSNIVVFFIKSK